MKNVITYLKTLWRRGLGSQSSDVSFDCRLTVGSPSVKYRFNLLRLVAISAFLLTIGVGDVWGETIYNEDFGSNTTSKTKAFSSSTDFSEDTTWSIMTDGGWNQGKDASTPSDYSGASGYAYAQKSSSAGDLILVFGDLTDYTDVVLSFGYRNGAGTKVARTFAAYVSGDGGDTWTEIECHKSRKTQTWEKITYEVPAAKLTDFAVKFSNTSNNQSAVDDVILTGTAAASCSANPSIGNASLNGSFNMTSTTSAIGVASGTWGPGTNCSWSDYGFVWSDGATTTTPTVSNNKVQVGTSGSATSWTGSVTPSGSTTPTSWTTGHTYYVRAYGRNNNGSATYAYGSAWSFTPYLVTFNKNDGGSTTSTQYVQGGVSTALTSNSFSRTGYNFNGWNTDADGTSGTGYTNGQNVSLSANLTLYAKWTAKQCTVNFDIEGGTGTITSVTATYGQAMPSKGSNLPTKTGYDFGGFWDGDGGTGTQYYNADGTSKINWNKDVTAAQTLYAKWTIKSYSVTWKVDGTNYSAGGSTSVNHGSHVSTLPTPPSPASYCGDKFMGWTDATDGAYVHGTSNLYTKASDFPNATGNQIFYAVFADYDE